MDLRELRGELLADRSRTGMEWCREWAGRADRWLSDLFARVAPERGVALLAVGGYGRSTLAPGSDLDLVLVHDGRQKRIKEVADAVWYPVWDSGQPLDHSVRTLKELRAAMESDIKVALGLLDARLIAGDAELGHAARARAMDLWQARVGRWLAALDTVTRDRHGRFGDLAFLLEPDLKEARGGLRDIQLLRSLCPVAPVLSDTLDDRALQWAEGLLTSARVELQRPAASAGNVLLLQDQDAVAAAMGLAAEPGNSAADVLMAAVADAARAISWASDDGWRRVESWLAGPKGRGGTGDVAIEPGLVLRDGEVTLLAGADPAVDTSLALRVAAASAEGDRPIARATLERLATRAMAPDGVWPPAVLNSLLRLLGAGRAAVAAIEALDQRGVWMRYLPEWAPVRNRPQRNAYHRFTVDRHLLEATANASALQSTVHRPDLLLLGTLLHDIGKGQGGDHTEIGIGIVGRLGPRLGLPPGDVAILANLVRHHLLLPDVATRRDLDDPATAATVAAAVGDRDTLELLAALTEADSLATGPAAWGRWKAGLVARLVAQVAATLEGRPPPDTGRAALTGAERELIAAGRLAVYADGGSLRVAAPDQSGLLATVAGVLNLSGAYVRSATTISDPGSGMALLRFEVAPAFDDLPDWNRFRTDVEAALDGRLDLGPMLAERDARYSRLLPRTSAHVPEARVFFDTDSSPDSTIVEVRAPDRGAVLYRVAGALSASGLTIDCALVSTLGAEAIDVFYVRSPQGGPVRDAGARDAISAAVLSALSA